MRTLHAQPFSLEPLCRLGPDALCVPGLPGVTRSVLRQLTVACNDRANRVHTIDADAFLTSHDPQPLLPSPGATLIGARLDFYLADSPRPRRVELQPPCTLRLQRAADAPLIQRWLVQGHYTLSGSDTDTAAATPQPPNAQNPEFKVQSSTFNVQTSEFEVQGSKFNVQGFPSSSAPTASPWSALELIEGPCHIPAMWRAHLGHYYEIFRAAFLQPTVYLAQSYPCPCHCGCLHPIARRKPHRLAAFCPCAAHRSPVIPLSPEDLVCWELSWPRLARALCQALQLQSHTAQFDLPNTRQIGSWSAAAVPVILTLPRDYNHFRQVITEVATRLRRPYILLAPTNTHLNALMLELLAHAQAACFDLASHLQLRDNGALLSRTLPGALFARFTPQPTEQCDEDAARKALGLLAELGPDLLTVFHLYCVKDLTLDAIARRCHCSKSTVAKHLASIRAATGMEPAQLRRLSPHIAQIEADLTDPRARRIFRKGLTTDTDPPDEETL